MRQCVLFLVVICALLTARVPCRAQTTDWTQLNGPWTTENVTSTARGWGFLGENLPVTYAVSAKGNYS
jgi:hypothetical protein